MGLSPRRGGGLRRLLLAGVVLIALVWGGRRTLFGPTPGAPSPVPVARAQTPATAPAGLDAVREAFDTHASGLMVEVAGRVDRVLADDRDGSRHQRFVLRLADDLTVLVAHNIDLAPRVPVSPGDAVTLRGQYEWNAQGGVVHWTHRDPAGEHDAGWIRHAGERYD